MQNITKNDYFEHKKLFWLSLSLYWFFHWLISFSTQPSRWMQVPDFVDLTLTILAGFLYSLILTYAFHRYSVHKYHMGRLVSVALLSSLLCGLVYMFTGFYLTLLIIGYKPEVQQSSMIKYIVSNSYPFIIWSILFICYRIWNELNIERIKAQKERSLAQNAQLEMLRYQLNPHFLFNTLSSLRALIRIDTRRAEDMVTRISEFLRYSLSYENENEALLSKEIEIVKYYLDIEKVRFGDKICIELDIDKPSENFRVPVFLIHPLVENAVKHGMQSSTKPLMIRIVSRLSGDELQVEVSNTGEWQEKGNNGLSSGKGLENVRKRLELLYPGNYSFEIRKNPGHVAVQISLRRGK